MKTELKGCRQQQDMFLTYMRPEKCVIKLSQKMVLLVFVPEYQKNPEKMCNKAVGNYADALEFVSVCYKTQKMFNKAVDASSSAILFLNAITLNK